MSKTRRVLLTLLAIGLLLRPVDILLAAMLPDASVDPVPQCMAGMLVSLLLLGMPAWQLRPWTSVRLPRTKAVWPGLLLGCASAVMLRIAMMPVDAAWQGWLNLTPDMLPVPESVPLALVYVVALAIVPALTEEMFFRGALLTGLLDGARRWTAVLLTTAAFALMHGNAANLPGHLAVSLVLTLLMLSTGHLAVPVAAHLVYNLTALKWMAIPGWGSLLCGAGLILVTVMLGAKCSRCAHLPMRTFDGLVAVAALAVPVALYFI